LGGLFFVISSGCGKAKLSGGKPYFQINFFSSNCLAASLAPVHTGNRFFFSKVVRNFSTPTLIKEFSVVDPDPAF
jgi:hypothetical protein